MNWSNIMFEYLTEQPKARERKNKNRAIGNLIAKQYGFDDGQRIELSVSKETMAEIVAEILTADRAWRKTVEEHPELRGHDYSEKKRLEVEAQKMLGYNV